MASAYPEVTGDMKALLPPPLREVESKKVPITRRRAFWGGSEGKVETPEKDSYKAILLVVLGRFAKRPESKIGAVCNGSNGTGAGVYRLSKWV